MFKQITPAELLALAAGSIVRVTTVYREPSRLPQGESAWTATLAGAEQRTGGVYFGFRPAYETYLGVTVTRPDSARCGFGYLIFRDTPKDHGVQKVEVELPGLKEEAGQ